MSRVNWKPTVRQLRQFGFMCLFAFPAVGWFWGAEPAPMVAIALLGLVMAGSAWIRPTAIKPVFLAFCIVALPIGLVVGEIAMLLVYFGVFLPIGLVFRIMGRDGLKRKIDRSAPSYWEQKKKPKSVESYYRQS